MPHLSRSDELVFFVNGRKVLERNADLEVTLLTFLRKNLRLTGTKYACGRGGCGACTVMVSKHDPVSRKIRHFSVTACLVPICSLYGAAVTTVEGVGSIKTRLHPVQDGRHFPEISDRFLSALEDFPATVPQGVQRYQSVDSHQALQDPVGRPIMHLSGLKHATGEAIFCDDIPMVDKELLMALVTSTRAHAKIISVDLSKALELPGVVDVITAEDIPGTNGAEDDKLLAVDKVLCVGQIVCAVVAETEAQAKRAVEETKIAYEDLEPVIFTIEDAIKHSSFLCPEKKLEQGNVEKAFEEVDQIVEGEVHVGGQEHIYGNTGVLVIPKTEDKELDIYVSTQDPAHVQKTVSSTLNIPINRITCHVKRVGGGFGGKVGRPAVLGAIAAVGANKTGYPIRLVLDREDDMLITGGRHPLFGKYKVREKNMYKTVDKTIYKQAFNPEPLIRCWNECLDKSSFHSRRMQVAEFNKKNYWRKRGLAVVPMKFSVGFAATSFHQAAALVHIYTDGSVLVTHGGNELGQGIHTKMLQKAEVEKSPHVQTLLGQGQGFWTAVAVETPVASRELKVPMSHMHICETSTATVPNTIATAASIGSDVNGRAVQNACQILLKRLEPIIKKNPEGTWEDWIEAAFEQRISLSATGYFRGYEAFMDWEKGEGDPFPYYVYGAASSEVEVDCLTGAHKKIRTDIVMDACCSLNPAIDIGQIEGSFTQGMGLYTTEELKYFPEGVLYSRGPDDYKIPTITDVPEEFNVSLLPSSQTPLTIYSSKGLGESGMFLGSSVFFAIADAVATARRERDIAEDFTVRSPATPERVRMACADRFTEMQHRRPCISAKSPGMLLPLRLTPTDCPGHASDAGHLPRSVPLGWPGPESSSPPPQELLLGLVWPGGPCLAPPSSTRDAVTAESTPKA
ncbi:aldehyde oxidase 2-like isoform X5 [Equus przewalskii]|uniref:Aldehyde oxidase 2-like isoform X5 n=1 Tax=Equus przewalskii TaxID=9798 RepID=A0ABM4ND92_EQUPR